MCELSLIKIEGTPPTSFFAIKYGTDYIGHCLLNHEPKSNDFLPSYFTGHIFYEISDEFKDSDHTKVSINKLIIAAKHIGLKEVIVVSREDDLPPKEILDGRNAIIIDVATGHDGVGYIRYKVDC